MLEFKNIDAGVSNITILRDISISFDEGKITSVIGPNGCGKTTLLQTLNGMSSVTKGTIFLGEENFLKLSQRERAKRLSFLPQFREAAPNISVRGLVEHGRFPYMGFSRRMSDEDQRAVNNALEYVGLIELSNKMVSELSGGMQQKAYLALQLAQNSPVMIFDEPMNHLDFPAQREMYALVEKLKDEGKTIILVLHDIEQALRISDDILIMKDRKIVFKGTPKECLERGYIKEVFDCEITSVNVNGTNRYVLT